MKEWHRTVLLLLMLLILVGFIVWSGHQTDANFVDTIR